MGLLQSWKSKARDLYYEEETQRSNSVTLPRKPAYVDSGAADGRDRFLIKAGPASPRPPGPPPSTAPPRAPYRDGPRSASVVVPPSPPQRPSLLPSPPSHHSGPALLPEYKTSAQFSHRVTTYKGSISTVYKARCTLTKTEVIIKQYIKAKMSHRALHKMQREIRLMYMLRRQPGVAQILGDFEDEHYYYIIMEYCAGGDLYHRMILKGQFDEHWACQKVITPLLEVLHYIHTEAHIVHRDIKPENLFLTKADEIKLGDFGLAIKQDEEVPFLRAGTLDYMAPEVLTNRVVDDITESPAITASDLQLVDLRPYNEKVDVWAVGVLAFELLVGEAPFYHEQEKETVKLIQTSPSIPFPARLRLSAWADFVRSALHKDPRQRPSAQELLAHPWVQQHRAAPALLWGLRKPGGALGDTLGRSGSLPSMALASPAKQPQAQQQKALLRQQKQQQEGEEEEERQQQEEQTSLQICVDAADVAPLAGINASTRTDPSRERDSPTNAPLSGKSAVQAGKEAAPNTAISNRGEKGGDRFGSEGPGPLWDGVRDDVRMSKAVSMAELRRTRSTGEAGLLEHAEEHHRSHGRGRSASIDEDSPNTPAQLGNPGRAPVSPDAARQLSGAAAAPPLLGQTAEDATSRCLGDALDAFAADLGTATQPSASTLQPAGSPASPNSGGSPTSGSFVGPQRPTTPSKPILPPATAGATSPLAGALNPSEGPLSGRPKSHSLPQAAFAAPKSNTRPGSSVAVVASPGGEGGSGQPQQSSTAQGSRILAAWGKKPSRLSVVAGSATGSPQCSPSAVGLGVELPGSLALPKTAARSPSISRPGWVGSLTGSMGGTLDEARPAAKPGSINRLKLYLSRQRAQ
ncbi:hypothetical protein N2152v2_007044 [Parachlorella kessleri]